MLEIRSLTVGGRRSWTHWALRPKFVGAALFVVLALCGGAGASADEPFVPELRIGDKAPRLVGLDWVQGKKVNSFKRGTVYVLDFWANGGRNRFSIPHVNALAEKHRDASLDVIGIAAPLGNELDHVEAIVEWLGDEMSYKVAGDPERRSVEAFLTDSGSATFFYPLSMVIDARGRLAWIGRADQGLAACVDDVLADRWDLDVARDAFEAELNERDLAARKMGFVLSQVWQAESDGRDLKELEYSRRLVEAHPMYESWRLGCYSVLRRMGRLDEARAEALAYFDGPEGREPFELIELAYRIAVTDPTPEGEVVDLDIALMAAERAVELNQRWDPDVLSVKATVHAARQEWAQAVALQTEALERAPDFEKPLLQASLDDFRARLAEFESGGDVDSPGADS
ncbi:MAG: hypothetical protein DHS20C15_23950 [Planctomycetota bacterium]|nr:MAG: hypothetical protein DHS20C15_23950 [Planctomycetota bacterium]